MSAGDRLRTYMDAASGSKPYKLFFYTSPYLRSRQVVILANFMLVIAGVAIAV